MHFLLPESQVRISRANHIVVTLTNTTMSDHLTALHLFKLSYYLISRTRRKFKISHAACDRHITNGAEIMNTSPRQLSLTAKDEKQSVEQAVLCVLSLLTSNQTRRSQRGCKTALLVMSVLPKCCLCALYMHK